MASDIAKRDQNSVPVLMGVTDDANQDIRMLRVDPVTGRLKITGSSTAGVSQIIAGTNVTISPSGGTGAVTVNATGGSTLSFIDNEIVSGSGTSYTLANTPVIGTVHLYARGQRLTPSVDFTISGASISTTDTWSAGDLLADYQK